MRIPGIPYVQGRNDYSDRDGLHYGIAIHNTSNDASDEAEASYAKRRTDGVSAHLYCDDDSVTQSLDLNARAGHAGSNIGNDVAIAVEITGANGWSRAQWLANVAWDKLGAALAWVIRNDPDFAGFQVRRASVEEMRRNPRVKAFYGHDDMRRAWGGTTHTDPGPNFPWDRLFGAVNQALRGESTTTPTISNPQEAHMPFVAKDAGTGQYYVCDLITSRPVPKERVGDVLYLAKQLGYGHGTEGVEWGDGGWARLGWTEAGFGRLQGAVALSEVQVTAQANVIADRLIASGANGLSEADHAGVVEDVKRALREGAE
jgi:N-acetyl-anhydromuramyl-L-alanine amidase AmpD